EALEKMARLKELEKEFPQLDCGACGAPTCHAFAEDVVRGYGKKEGCIFLQKKQETGEKDR
ncbi:(Fe-S)-binding protein, partial [Acidaminococcus fermentans]